MGKSAVPRGNCTLALFVVKDLATSSGWPHCAQNAWKLHLEQLKSTLDSALAHPDSLTLFNALWAFLTAPALVIAPFFKETSSAPAFDSPDATVNAALKKVLVGQERKAFKLLDSNGVATVTPEVISVLRALHPDRPDPLVKPEPTGPQFIIVSLAKQLFTSAENKAPSKDIFGWSTLTELLSPCLR